MYTFWPWRTAKGNYMLFTWWYIMGLPPICFGVLGSTVPKLSLRSWLCLAVGLNFLKRIALSPCFGSLPWSGLSCIQLKVLWVLICFRRLRGLLNILPELWCLQGSGILVGCTDSASILISCTDHWLLFVRPWSLRPRQNRPLLPWSSWLVMCMHGSWSVRLVCLIRHVSNVLGGHLFRYNLLGCILSPCCFHLAWSYQKNGWLSCHCRSHHCSPRQVRPFLFMLSF